MAEATIARQGGERPSLVLGSSSPRRRDLLDAVGLTYEVIKPETPEIPEPGEAPLDYVQRNAREKAEWVAAALARRDERPAHGYVVISADTVVVLGRDILEKPRDVAHATEMLGRLSGATHTVVSGVTLLGVGAAGPLGPVTFAETTAVRIKPLSAREIAAYIRTGEPLDKAGGYAAQGIGSYMVESIQGSYANVVGLPVAAVVARLERDFGYDLWR
jgi:septum formation protein